MSFFNADYFAMGGAPLPKVAIPLPVVPQPQHPHEFVIPQCLRNTTPLQMTTEQHLEQLAKLLQNPMILASLNNENFLKNIQALNNVTAPVPMPTPTNGKRKFGEEIVFSPEYPKATVTATPIATSNPRFSYTRSPTPPPNSPPRSPPMSPDFRASAFETVGAPAPVPAPTPAPTRKLSPSPQEKSPSPPPQVKDPATYASFASFISPNGGAYAAFPDASPNSYSSALHQLVLLQHWVPILEKLSPANKSSIWDTCTMMSNFKNYNKNSFRKTITAWATNILPNMASITILFGGIGYLKHHGVLKNEFCFPNTNNPVFRTFITNPIPGCNIPVKKPVAPPKVVAPLPSTTTFAISAPSFPPLSCDKESERAAEPSWKRSKIMELSSIINA